jgi:hypothetical protein
MGDSNKGLAKMTDIFVKDFSEFPGPRKESIGPNSGERFREEILYPAVLAQGDSQIRVNLDGTAGYGSSFLEEAFGGLVRKGIPESKMQEILDNLISDEDPSLIDEIREYVNEALMDAKG